MIAVGISTELQFIVEKIVAKEEHKPFIRFYFFFTFCKIFEIFDTAYVFLRHASHKVIPNSTLLITLLL